MRNFMFFLIVFIFMGMPAFSQEYRVLRVIDGDTIYVDFNNNGKCDKDERVRLNGIDAFEIRPTLNLKWQMKKYNLTLEEALGLGYLGMCFAKNELLNKLVSIEFSSTEKTDKYSRPLVSVTYDDGKSFEAELLKQGLATVYALSNLAPDLSKYEDIGLIRNQAVKAQELNLMYYNYKTKKYYSINSREALNPENRIINVK